MRSEFQKSLICTVTKYKKLQTYMLFYRKELFFNIVFNVLKEAFT